MYNEGSGRRSSAKSGTVCQLMWMILREARRPMILVLCLAALYAVLDTTNAFWLFHESGYFPFASNSLATVGVYSAIGFIGAGRFLRPAGRTEWISLPADGNRKYLALVLAWGVAVPIFISITMTLSSALAMYMLSFDRHWYLGSFQITRSLAKSLTGFPAAIASLSAGIVFRRAALIKLAGLLLGISLAGNLAVNAYVRFRFDPQVATGMPWGLFLDPVILLYRSKEGAVGLSDPSMLALDKLSVVLENLSLFVTWLLIPAAAVILGRCWHHSMEAVDALRE